MALKQQGSFGNSCTLEFKSWPNGFLEVGLSDFLGNKISLFCGIFFLKKKVRKTVFFQQKKNSPLLKD
jgi:hypothetical protein